MSDTLKTVIVDLQDDEARRSMATLALAMYSNEPCRICGELLTMIDLNDAVFAGYSQDSKSRAAHKSCWDKNIHQAQWAKQ